MNPLLALGPLPADIEHPEKQLFKVETHLNNASRFDPSSQDVILIGHIAGFADAVKAVQEVLGRIVELVLSAAVKGSFGARVGPENLDCRGQLFAEGCVVEGSGLAWKGGLSNTESRLRPRDILGKLTKSIMIIIKLSYIVYLRDTSAHP